MITALQEALINDCGGQTGMGSRDCFARDTLIEQSP